jgi:hypothetical protein
MDVGGMVENLQDGLFRLRLRVLDSDLVLECMHAETRDVLERYWSRCVALARVSAADVAVRIDDDDLPLPESSGYVLASQLTIQAIDELAGRLFMFHACGLAEESGRVVALIGTSGMGKTTAAAELATSTFGYVTDETLAVDDDGGVLAYPKPLSLIEDSGPAGHKVQRGPDELGLRGCPDHLTLARLVLLDRGDDPARAPGLGPVPLMDALLELIPNTSYLTAFERPLQRLCLLIDRCGGVHRLSYPQIADTAPLLTGLLGRLDAVTASTWTSLGAGAADDGMAWAMWDARVHRVPALDGVLIDDEALLLVGQAPMRLAGIGLTIWQEAAQSPTLAELERRVVAVHGPHPDSGALVRDAVETMRQAGAVAFMRPRTAAEFFGTAAILPARGQVGRAGCPID